MFMFQKERLMVDTERIKELFRGFGISMDKELSQCADGRDLFTNMVMSIITFLELRGYHVKVNYKDQIWAVSIERGFNTAIEKDKNLLEAILLAMQKASVMGMSDYKKCASVNVVDLNDEAIFAVIFSKERIKEGDMMEGCYHGTRMEVVEVGPSGFVFQMAVIKPLDMEPAEMVRQFGKEIKTWIVGPKDKDKE